MSFSGVIKIIGDGPRFSSPLALGNERFEEEVESLTGRRMTAKKRGRPVGWRKKVLKN